MSLFLLSSVMFFWLPRSSDRTLRMTGLRPSVTGR